MTKPPPSSAAATAPAGGAAPATTPTAAVPSAAATPPTDPVAETAPTTPAGDAAPPAAQDAAPPAAGDAAAAPAGDAASSSAEQTTDIVAGQGGVMTDEVGVVTGELTLRTSLSGDQVTVGVQYKDADEWYAVTGAKATLKDPADLEAVHAVAVGILNRPEG